MILRSKGKVSLRTMTQIFIILLLLGKYCLADENKTVLSIKDIYFVQRMPIGIGYQNFTQFAYVCQMFADKSLIIKEVIEDTNRIISITCPRRWGKTLNLNLMKTFFHVNADRKGKQVLPIDINLNYRMFAYGEITVVKRENDTKNRFVNATTNLEKLMLISEHPYIMEKYLARYPVIHINFCVVGFAKNFHEMMAAFTNTLALAFQEHEYMSNVFDEILKNSSSDEEAKIEARRGQKLFYNFLNERDELKDNDKIESLSFLSEALHRHFNTKVIILFDDYDIPWSTTLSATWSSESDAKAFLDVYSNFLETTFDSDPFVEKIIMMGKLPCPIELRNSIFKRTVQYNVLNGKLMEYFGITPSIARRMLYEARIPDNLTSLTRRWYNGYHVNYQRTKLFNAWSLVNFVVQTRRKPRFFFHWIHCEKAVTFLHNCFQLESCRNPLRSLVYRQTITIKCFPHFMWEDLKQLHKVWQIDNYTVDDHQFADRALMWLYTLGYLTLSEDVDTLPCTYLPVKLPNLEIESTLMRNFKRYYEQQLGIEGRPFFYIQFLLRSTFDKFARNNDQNGPKLAEALGSYVSLKPGIFAESTSREDNLNKILTYMMIDLLCVRKEEITSNQNLPATDALIVFSNRTVIISIQFDKPGAQMVCNEAEKHLEVVNQKSYSTKGLKIIGINIFSNSSVEVWGNLL